MTVTVTADTVLKRQKADGSFEDVKVGSLWEESPLVVIVLRRPGCIFCREEALLIWQQHAKFEELGAKVILTLHEWKQREVDAFVAEYWGGPIFFDESKVFYAEVHDGHIAKGSVLSLINPFSQARKNLSAVKSRGLVKDSNLKGEGLTLGGVAVYKRGGERVYTHAEKTFGDIAPVEEILAAAQRAAA